MYLQGVALSEFFVPHDFTPMFCHCNMSRQSSFGRTLCGMLQQRMLQKGRFLSCEQLGSVRLQLYYRFNQSQTAKKGNTILSCLRTCDKDTTGRKYMDNYIVLECNKKGSNVLNEVSQVMTWLSYGGEWRAGKGRGRSC